MYTDLYTEASWRVELGAFAWVVGCHKGLHLTATTLLNPLGHVGMQWRVASRKRRLWLWDFTRATPC